MSKKEAAVEGQYFRERDQELIANMKKMIKEHEEKEKEDEKK